MWTQYTREKPAKSGWTIFTMAIALAATVGLAQLQVSARQPVKWNVAETIRNGAWPISVKLPDAVKWSPSGQRGASATNPGEIIYLGEKDGDTVCRISVYCGDPETDAHKSQLRELFGNQTVGRYAIEIAQEGGAMILLTDDTGSQTWALCNVDRLDGSTVSILIRSKLKSPFVVRLASWICEESVKSN